MVVERLAKLSPILMWKRENVPNELMDLDKEICRQNVEKGMWFLLDLCAEIQIARDKPKMQLFHFQ